MEITASTIYLLHVLSSLESITELVLFISAFVVGISVIIYVITTAEGDRENSRIFKAVYKKAMIVACLSLILNTFTPNKETLVAMYIIPKVTNNESFAQVPENIVMFINDYIKDHLNNKEK